MVVFLSGKMSGLPDLGRSQFQMYDKLVHQMIPDVCVLNPAVLPTNLPIDRCLPITFAMIDQADTVLMLPNWEDSVGAKLEHDYALYNKKRIWHSLP